MRMGSAVHALNAARPGSETSTWVLSKECLKSNPTSDAAHQHLVAEAEEGLDSLGGTDALQHVFDGATRILGEQIDEVVHRHDRRVGAQPAPA